MYSKQIKNVNTVNMMVIGLLSMMVLLHYRMNDAANFCTGTHLTPEEKKIELSKPIHER